MRFRWLSGFWLQQQQQQQQQQRRQIYWLKKLNYPTDQRSILLFPMNQLLWNNATLVYAITRAAHTAIRCFSGYLFKYKSSYQGQLLNFELSHWSFANLPFESGILNSDSRVKYWLFFRPSLDSTYTSAQFAKTLKPKPNRVQRVI